MSVYWGSREVSGVAVNGVVTQLFPVGCPHSAMTSTAAGWPPAAAGKVRFPVAGRLNRLTVTSDGVNGGYVELWDVGGLEQGAANNINSGGDTLTDAFVTANGTLIARENVQPAVAASAPLTSQFEHIPFNKGLAVRYVGDGKVYIAPIVEGGFMVTERPAG